VDNLDVKWWPDWRQIFDTGRRFTLANDSHQASNHQGPTLDDGVTEIPVVRPGPHREHELLHDLLQPEPVCRIIE
jgi:hypothetical protein